MSEVTVTASFDGQPTARYTGTVERGGQRFDCGRWATLVHRDWWVNPGVTIWDSDPIRRRVEPRPGPVFQRDPSLLVELSDGTVFGGEMSRHFAEGRCVEWVRSGKR